MSARNASTSASVGGRPTRSRLTRRISVSSSASGAGVEPFLLEPRQDEAVDRVPDPGRVRHRRRLGPHRLRVGPVPLVRGLRVVGVRARRRRSRPGSARSPRPEAAGLRRACSAAATPVILWTSALPRAVAGNHDRSGQPAAQGRRSSSRDGAGFAACSAPWQRVQRAWKIGWTSRVKSARSGAPRARAGHDENGRDRIPRMLGCPSPHAEGGGRTRLRQTRVESAAHERPRPRPRPPFGRRHFLTTAAGVAASLLVAGRAGWADAPAPAASGRRSLSFLNTHTGESVSTVYWADGEYRPTAWPRSTACCATIARAPSGRSTAGCSTSCTRCVATSARAHPST